MISKFQQAACHNNEGINAFLVGNFSSSIDLFSKSVSLMKELLVLLNAQSNRSSSAPSDSNHGGELLSHHDNVYASGQGSVGDSSSASSLRSYYHCHQYLQRTRTIEIPEKFSTMFLSSSSVIDFSLYNRVIYIPVDIDASILADHNNSYSSSVLDVFIAAAIFNLALAHHYLAFEQRRFSAGTMTNNYYKESMTNNNNVIATSNMRTNPRGWTPMMFHKVEKLYGIVLQLFGDDDGAFLLNTHTGLLIKLACVNNLSYILCYKMSSCYCSEINDINSNNNEERTSTNTPRTASIATDGVTFLRQELCYLLSLYFTRQLQGRESPDYQQEEQNESMHNFSPFSSSSALPPPNNVAGAEDIEMEDTENESIGEDEGDDQIFQSLFINAILFLMYDQYGPLVAAAA